MPDLKQLDNVVLPQELFSSMMELQRKWQHFSDELEDFLISRDTDLMKKIKASRQEHLAGKTRPLSKLKEELF